MTADLKPVKVNAGRQDLAVIVQNIPGDLLCSRRLNCTDQSANRLTQTVEDRKCDGHFAQAWRDIISNPNRLMVGIAREWIRETLNNQKFIRNYYYSLFNCGCLTGIEKHVFEEDGALIPGLTLYLDSSQLIVPIYDAISAIVGI